MTHDRIHTSHAGSLPRIPELIAANAARTFAEDGFTLERTPEFEGLLTTAVGDLVQRQKDVGITIPGDGDYGKAMSKSKSPDTRQTYRNGFVDVQMVILGYGVIGVAAHGA